MSYRYKAVEYLDRCKNTVTPGKLHSIGGTYFCCTWDGNVTMGKAEGVWKTVPEEQFIQILIEYYIKEDLDRLTDNKV
jgi:hypothetical protein